jgi:O-acetylserine/cysteine efflux transporter
VLWGVNFVVIKWGLRGISPFVLGALRFTFAALPAVFFLRPPRVPLRLYLGYGLASGLGQFAFLFVAINVGMPAGLASLVAQSQAFFTVILAALFCSERPKAVQVLGMVVAAAGLTVIGSAQGVGMPLNGFLLTLCAALCWALGNLGSRALAKHGPVNVLAFVVWSSLIPPLPFLGLACLLEGSAVIRTSLVAMDLRSWLAVAYLAFVATLVGYGLWNRLLRAYAANLVVPFTLLIPVVGLVAAFVALGEKLSAAQALGGALVVAGLAIPLLPGAWRPRAAKAA